MLLLISLDVERNQCAVTSVKTWYDLPVVMERNQTVHCLCVCQLIVKLEPRLILDAHTHNFCQTQYNGTPEWTIASFSWRNRNNPSYILVSSIVIQLLSAFYVAFCSRVVSKLAPSGSIVRFVLQLVLKALCFYVNQCMLFNWVEVWNGITASVERGWWKIGNRILSY